MSPSSHWIDAAAALRHAVLLTPGVSGLSESAAFQTSGPGRSVRGIALESVPDGARVSVGVVLHLEEATAPIAGIARQVRTAAEAAWARARVEDEAGAPLALEVLVHVVDMDRAV